MGINKWHYIVFIGVLFIGAVLLAFDVFVLRTSPNQPNVSGSGNFMPIASSTPAIDQSATNTLPVSSPLPESAGTAEEMPVFSEPLEKALTRVTRKPFGIYITPGNSPVKPERFSGYHTGVDFEVLPEEENTDIIVYAICEGPLIEKRNASGYGGIAVQECQFENRMITVIYGHIRLSSILIEAGAAIEAGENFAVLGRGYSPETDGERKHLHLGIHKGAEINIRGYVNSRDQLVDWIDISEYLK